MNRRLILLYSVPSLLFVAAILVTIGCIGRVSTIGSEVYGIEQKTISLRQQNARIELELAKEQSLTSLSTYAVASGYIPITGLHIIDGSEGPVALQMTQ